MRHYLPWRYRGQQLHRLVSTFFALFTFVTGYTPSKYNSHPVPRSAGFIFLYWAVVPLILGIATYVYDRYSKPERRR